MEKTRVREKTSVVVRVLVVADIRFYGEGLAACLERSKWISVTGIECDADNALGFLAKNSVDIVLVDMAMKDGLRAVRTITNGHPGMDLIALAIDENKENVLQCAAAGIAGYVRREASIDDLLNSITSVRKQEFPCSAKVARGLCEEVRRLSLVRQSSQKPDASCLTPREVEIITLIDGGLSNDEIAGRLYLALSTVKNHVHNILEKLKVRRRGEAAAVFRDQLFPQR